ncbi:MAG: DUF6141 family protein [Bacteroidetes bacterium]|nr:DUF6141 family protein [Bacteroidota bacterium]
MDEDILFKERQRFKQWWIWLAFLGINALFLYAVYVQVICGKPFGNNPAPDAVLIIIMVMTILLSVFFFSFNLTTVVKDDGIYVRFFPFHFSFRHYSWEMISKAYVRQYNPIGEYGGWGYRLGIFGKGKAWNVSGNKGLQLEFNNKKKLLIGTKKPDELAAVLTKMGQYKP